MKKTTRNRLFSILGGIVGAIIGWFYPTVVQGYLPILGIGIGIFYFFSANSVNKDPDAKKVTNFDDFTWYLILRIAMGLLIGGAITSTIVMTMDIFEQQNAQAYLWQLFL